MSYTETAAVEQLVLQGLTNERQPFVLNGPNGREFIAGPVGGGAWATEEIRPRENEGPVFLPKHVTQAVRVQTVSSIIEYIDRFKNFDSALFADIDTSTILSVIDYHKMPGANIDSSHPSHVPGAFDPQATHGKHTVSLAIPKSLEWQTWTGIDGQLKSHVDFSNFLEENAMDILALGVLKDSAGNQVEDAPSTILELCRELQVRSSYGAASEIRNGDYANIEMQKGDDITTKRNVALPVSIDISIPVYFGEASVQITAFIRRKVDQGSLKLGIKLLRPELIRQHEFRRIVDTVANEVELTTLYGKPA
jgi:uncharacterized protein YfdQ (DUF2303 family)